MKWLLWIQLVVVLAAIAVGVIAVMTPTSSGAVIVMGIGFLPIVLIVGAVVGLIAVKRRKGHIYAGIVQLAPAMLTLGSALTSDYSGAESYVSPEVAERLRWLTWSWWLMLAAVVLALVSALLLFRQMQIRPVRPSGPRQDQSPD